MKTSKIKYPRFFVPKDKFIKMHCDNIGIKYLRVDKKDDEGYYIKDKQKRQIGYSERRLENNYSNAWEEIPHEEAALMI